MINWSNPGFSAYIAGTYLGIMSFLWLLLLVGVKNWAKNWRLNPLISKAVLPPVSVIVPARNEAGKIGLCVKAILESKHEDIELILVDDSSTDGTWEEAKKAAGDDFRFHTIKGGNLPPGWAGKPWAVSQGAANAAFEHILFVDADTILSPDAIGSAINKMIDEKLDLLSVFGTWKLSSFWEKTVIPVVGWFIRGTINLDEVNDPSKGAAFANGQFILVKRNSYEKIAGHSSVKSEVLEDVKIAKVFKQNAFKIGLFYAPWAFEVRLYESLKDILKGYTKNFYEGMNRSPVIALGIVLFILVGTLLPFIALLIGLFVRFFLGWLLPSAIWLVLLGFLCALIIGFRLTQERTDGRSGWYALTHPLGNIILILIVIKSMISLEVEWKGRNFQDGKAEH